MTRVTGANKMKGTSVVRIKMGVEIRPQVISYLTLNSVVRVG